MSDREIAEDILAGQKYLSNYYYAPGILESGDPALRSTFQEVHADSTEAAKSVFDYLQAKGWYQVRKADEQDMQDLRNTVSESQQVTQSQNAIGGSDMHMNQGQQNWTGTQSMEGQGGFGPSSLSQGTHQQVNLPSWARGGFGGQSAFGSQSSFSGQSAMGSQGWTGTQSMEGQSGYGPSSLSQGASWGGAPSWSSGQSGQYQGVSQQINLPSWARGGFGGQSTFGSQSSFGGQSAMGSQGWTGTQSMEGQSGMGPSSLGGSLGGGLGVSSQYQGVPQQVNLPGWARGGFGGQGNYGQGNYGQQSFGYPQTFGSQSIYGSQQGIGGQQSYMNPHTWRSSFQTGNTGWTGTTAGEGQSGYGPSSLGGYGIGSTQFRQGFNQGVQGNWQSQ